MNAISMTPQNLAGLSGISSFNPLEANGQSQKQNNNSKSSIIDISPQGRLKNMIGSFSRSSIGYNEMNIKYSALLPFQDDPDQIVSKEEANLLMLIRLVAKDDEEFQKMKDQLHAQFQAASNLMSKIDQGNPTLNIFSPQGNSANGVSGLSFSQTSISSSFTFVSSSAQTFSSESSGDGASSASTKVNQASVMIDINIRITRIEAEIANSNQIMMSDPLILDMTGEGINLTPAGKGANFDINGDGKLDVTSWIKNNSAFLAMDKDGDGEITSGRELFGDQNGAPNGFLELAKYDSNKDGVIDRRDPVYQALKVYRDMNSNGRMEKEEITSVEKAGIASINLSFSKENENVNGNKLFLKGSFTTTDGKTRNIVDALLGYRQYK